MEEFLEWLKENKININGKYKGKRWGSVGKSENGDWNMRICVQYDEYLDPVLSNESAAMQELVRKRTGHGDCGRCIEGKCAFTGFDLVNPTEEQLGLAKRLIKFRINAINDGRIPKCSYIKLSKRGEANEPCAVHKVCDPKCKAMKRY
ncbi:MAG: hypothetical protein K2N72_01905 [Oscillospiraceae bacterium]|nr:hypothetical protein [Oscillospiraceae bacterium]